MVPGMMGQEPARPPLKAFEALQTGQKAGVIADLNGDAVPDMLAVDLKGNVWALFAQGAYEKPINVTLTVPHGSLAPVTVTVSDTKHRAGMYVVRPGMPAVAGRAYKGVMKLTWHGPDGKARNSKSMVVRSKTVEIQTAGPTDDK